MLRLRVQVQAVDGPATNRIDVESLDDIDRQLLKEAMKVGRRLQQRLSMDWLRA
jgi:CBS domain-containing protein